MANRVLKVGVVGKYFVIDGESYQCGNYAYKFEGNTLLIWDRIGSNHNNCILRADISTIEDESTGSPFADIAAIRTWLNANFFFIASGSGGGGGSYAPLSHTHGGDDIVSGIVPPVRLGNTTPTASKALFGNSEWRSLAASDILSGQFDAARLAAGTATDGLVIKSVLGVPTWGLPSSGGNAWSIGGVTATSGQDQIFGTTSVLPNTITYKVGNREFMKAAWISGDKSTLSLNADSPSLSNWNTVALGGASAIVTGIRGVAIGGVGGKAFGTNAISIGGAAAENNNTIAIGPNTSYANGDNSMVVGNYAANGNFTGSLSMSCFGEASFSSNTANNQLLMKYTGGILLNNAFNSKSFEMLSNGMLKMYNVTNQTDNATAISAGLAVSTIYHTNGILKIVI